MRRSLLGAVIAVLALGGVGTVQAQSGDPDRVDRQAALLNAASIENAFRSVERRIRVTDADDLWTDEWTGLVHPPSGDWWLSSWTERGLTARYCEGVLAVYADDDELKGVGRDQRAVQVAPVAYGNGRTGLHLIVRSSRLFRGAHGRGDGSLPACMPVPSTTGDRAGLVLAVPDPRLTTVGRRWQNEDRTVSCAAPDTGTMTERRRIPIQVTAVNNCPAATPNCNDLREFAPVPPAWPADCATRETMLSATPPTLPADAACSDWVRWRSNCQIVYAAAPSPADIPDPVITWEDGPVERFSVPCSCSCPLGDIVGGSCTAYREQNTEWRIFVLRPGSPEERTQWPAAGRTPSNLDGQLGPVIADRSGCSCTTPPPVIPPVTPVTPTTPTTPVTPTTSTTPVTPTTPTTPTTPVTPTTPTTPTNPRPPTQQPDPDPGGESGDEGSTSSTSESTTSTTSDVPEQDTVSDPNFAPDANSNGGGGGGGDKPIILDLDGDGVELVPLEESTAFFDINGDGYRERMAWAAADDGFLAYDKDGDNKITAHDELSFVSYVEGARTDLEGLRHFDTDGDGHLDPDDSEWEMFRVWQDLDQDGESDPGEVHGLDEEGIESISLTSDGIRRTAAGNTVFGEGEYVGPHGPRTFWDAALRRGERKQ